MNKYLVFLLFEIFLCFAQEPSDGRYCPVQEILY